MLSQFLITQVFAFLLIFCRTGSAMMLLPGFGELYVPIRVRLLMALFVSLVLTPVIQHMPPVPNTTFALVSLLIAEIMIGLFMGGLSRLLIETVQIASMIIAYQASLASALTQDITQVQGQGTSLGNFLSITALLLIFASNLHHVMLKGLADSYTLFAPGQFPHVEDFTHHVVDTVNSAFAMAVKMASPHIVVGILLYLGAGILSRLMPNIQIFFILQAPQLLLSFFVLLVSLSAIMLWYLDYFRTTLASFLAP